MSHVSLIDSDQTTPERQALLQTIHRAFGATPNMFKAVANSPAALQSMWGSFGALGAGVLGAKLGEQIAVAIANSNRCAYCLAAHTVLGQNAGATASEMASAQRGQSDDPRTAAALAFALKVVHRRAQVTQEDIERLRQVGLGDEHIVEILAHVALNLFTNYVNVALNVPVDFPKVALYPPEPADSATLPEQLTLYHDGCAVCLSMEATLTHLLKGSGKALESVNLGLDNRRGGEAMVRGVSRLPSLVIGSQVIRLDDHSPIEHYVAEDEKWVGTALSM